MGWGTPEGSKRPEQGESQYVSGGAASGSYCILDRNDARKLHSVREAVLATGKQGKIVIRHASNVIKLNTGFQNDFRKRITSFQSIVHKTGQACLQKNSTQALKT
jgi:hypothetical protein